MINEAPLARIDYVEVVDSETLQPVQMVGPNTCAASGRVLRQDTFDRQHALGLT